jgi:hypothetical protein
MKKSTKFLFKITLSLFIFSQSFYIFLVILPQKQKVISGNLTSSSDTLSNSRLSYSGKVSGAHTAGATTINLQSGAGNAPDINTNHLFPKDVVSIGPTDR